MVHWTKELFQKDPELFLASLEGLVERSAAEVDLLLQNLKEQRIRVQRILDLNCGIGRHSIELGKRGFEVVGTDLSPLYITIAKERAKKEGVEDHTLFKVADMRKIGSALVHEKPFDGILNLWTSFGFYDDETNDEILRQCAGLVKTGGFFALEIVNRDYLIKHFQASDFTRFKNMILLEERDLDFNTSRMKSTWTYLIQKGEARFVETKRVTIDHRVWSIHELREMFNRTGWTTKSVTGGLRQTTPDTPLAEAKSVLLIATKSK
ncbi:MAG: class I SAM-dependent methyltransferase [Candidatus Bathyarchaeia archaeon]|jgi:2-polyprenyl-3-methyl-5-hydroxy-6-metoxy-1,4-benzoquinol methylase